jgi:hypothetical protein
MDLETWQCGTVEIKKVRFPYGIVPLFGYDLKDCDVLFSEKLAMLLEISKGA